MSNLISIAVARSLTPGRRSLENILASARYIQRTRIPGAVVECGVFRGGTAGLLAQACQSGRQLWLYDTWEGIPAPGPPAVDGQAAQRLGGSMRASMSEALQHIKQQAPGCEPIAIKGDIRQTLPLRAPDRIALLHIDTDWYDSVVFPLVYLHPRLSPGAVVILDDFGHWEGARKAFYEYLRQTGAEPLIERSGPTQLSWIVGKQHTRGRGDGAPW